MTLNRRARIVLARIAHALALPRLVNQWLPWVVLVVALCATGLLWKNAHNQAERDLQAEFNFNVQEVVRDIELRMETYKLLLHGLQGLFASSTDVSRDEFRTYIETLDLMKRYPGIQGLGYSQIVPTAQIPSHLVKIRNSGFPEYEIKPASNERKLITSVIYIEPFAGPNLRAFGFDMYSEPIRRAAMERARDLNQAALSGKIVLKQETDTSVQPGFVIYLPIYKNNTSVDSIDNRKAHILGWVHAQFRADDMLALLSHHEKSKLEIAVYDGETISEQMLLSGAKFSQAKPSSHELLLTSTRKITIAGHDWTLEARSRPNLEAGFDREKPQFILITGICTSFLLAFLMQLLINGRARAMRMAKDINRELIKSEYRWKFALEGAGEGVWDWNIQTGSMFMSQRLKEMLGYDEDEYPNTYEAWQKNIHPEDQQSVRDALNAYLEDKAPEFVVEERLRCKDGSWKWILMRGMIVSRDRQGKALRMIGTHADISERHQKDESLRLSAAVFKTVNEAVVVTDADNRIVSVNPSFNLITGYTIEEVLGKTPDMLADGKPRPELSESMWKSLNTTGSWLGEVVNRRKNGELYVAWISISIVRDDKGQITNYVSIFSDISERKETEQRMQYLAHFDPLTDLPNRALFNDRLRQALVSARRNTTGVALLFIDLDRFKPVNDTLGHAVGDLLLREVAYRLLDCIRESDTAGRIGGDEFVVLLPGIASKDAALLVADKILLSIQEPFALDGHVIRISASIGIAIFPQHGATGEEILSNADNAMYHAKRGGGSTIATFDQIESEHP